MCLNNARWVANSIEPDQTPHSVASDLGLHCLLRPVGPKLNLIVLEFQQLNLIVLEYQQLNLIVLEFQ